MPSESLDSADGRLRVLSLAAVIATSYGVGLSFGIGFPITTLTFEGWRQPEWMLGIASAAPALGVLAALGLVPHLIRRLGLVNAIAGGCALAACGFLLMLVFQSPWSWIAIRFAMSGALAVPWLASETWINAVAREETRGRVVSLYATTFFLGFMTGPLLLQLLGIDGIWPLLAATMIAAVWGLPVLVARRLAPSNEAHQTQPFAKTALLAPAAMLGGLISGFAEMTCLSLVPGLALIVGHSTSDALWLASLMTLGGILSQFPIGWLADKMSRVGLLLALAAAFTVLMVALPLFIEGASSSRYWAFALGGSILGFYTVSLTLIGERVPIEALASANVAFLVMYQLGGIVGPIMTGVAMTVSPVYGFVVTMIVMMTLCAVALAFLERRIQVSRARHQRS